LTQVERISAQLKPEIADRRVEVVGSADTVAVRLLSTSFPSARSALSKAEEPLIKRIAQALDKEPGTIRVIGYTDNIGSSTNNNELSKARAESAMKMLRQDLTNPERVSAEGRGSADPIAPNDTREGRAKNRRVEFQLPAEKPP
jgi:type VI secretion system protein ImpK